MCAPIYLKHILSCGCMPLHYLSEPHGSQCAFVPKWNIFAEIRMTRVHVFRSTQASVVWHKGWSERNMQGTVVYLLKYLFLFWRFSLTFQRQTVLNSFQSCWKHQKKEINAFQWLQLPCSTGTTEEALNGHISKRYNRTTNE